MTVRPPLLTMDEESAWRSLATLMIALPRAIDDDMTGRGGLSLTNYVVLMRLSEATEQSMRMSDLADGAVLSPSRVTRIVAAMVTEGLVTRHQHEVDKRVAIVSLTEVGLRRLQENWPTHLDAVRRRVLDGLTVRDLADLKRICQRLLARF
jgi:DNA-binding MarR family transcriptional regulator